MGHVCNLNFLLIPVMSASHEPDVSVNTDSPPPTPTTGKIGTRAFSEVFFRSTGIYFHSSGKIFISSLDM